MKMVRVGFGAMVVLVTTIGCDKLDLPGGGGGKKGCPKLSVKLDGKKVKMERVLGYSHGTGFSVAAYNHGDIGCDEVGKARVTPEGEIEARAVVDPTHNMVAVGASHVADEKVRMVDEPKKAGDDIAICVPRAVDVTIGFGPHKGKTARVKGLFKGRYCGVRK